MILIKLLLAHLLGDFLLQPNRWVKQKEKKKLATFYLYLHCLLHAGLAWLLIFELNFWLPALAIFILHLGIDATKLLAQRPKTKRTWFFIDQLLHLMSLIFIWWWYAEITFDFSILLSNTYVWLVFTLGVALTLPASLCIKMIIENWAPATNSTEDDSLQNAGKYIGIMERLLVFILVLTGNIGAVGFLLAAKSVFRFGDLRQAQDRKLTEYVLIGTLLSFGVALTFGLIARAVVDF